MARRGRPQNQTAGVIGFGVPGMMLWLRTACCIARNNNKTQVIRAAAAHGDWFATVTKSPR